MQKNVETLAARMILSDGAAAGDTIQIDSDGSRLKADIVSAG